MIMNNEEDFSGFWPSAVCNVITFYSYITLSYSARISVHAWIQNSYEGGGAKIVLSAGGGCQRLIFVILLLRCEFNQFEFLRKEGGVLTHPHMVSSMGLILLLIITSRKETTRRRSKNRYNETIDFSGHEYPTKVDFVYQRKCTQCYKDHIVCSNRESYLCSVISLISQQGVESYLL